MEHKYPNLNTLPLQLIPMLPHSQTPYTALDDDNNV